MISYGSIPLSVGDGELHGLIERGLDAIGSELHEFQDPVGRDDDWLTDEALGFLSLEDAVIDALQLFQPTNTDGTEFLIIEPMRLVGISNPDKPSEPNDKWGSAVQTWEIVYKCPLDQSRQ